MDVTHPDGQSTTYSYDAVGRQTGASYSDATPDVTTTYDLAGRPVQVTDGTGATTYAYDAIGQVEQVVAPTGTVGYEWDDAGRLTELTYPTGHAVAYTYDDAGQLMTVTDWANRSFTYTWAPDGHVETLTFPNGVVTEYDYDDAGQPLAITTTDDTGVDLLDLGYAYTSAGLLTDQTTARSTQARAPPTPPTTTSQVTWDGQARIDEITGHLGGTFAYDDAGSPTTLSGGRTLTYDDARQLTTLTTETETDVVTTEFTYDDRGNRATASTGSQTTTHAYDLANRLTTITTGDQTTAYTYGTNNLRATATTGSGPDAVTETYTWDTTPAVPLLLTDATHAYLYGASSTPLAQVDLADDDQVDYLHADALGSIRTTTSDTGQVTGDADYDAYGTSHDPTNDALSAITRFGYAGEYTDPTGYIYLRNRYYDPTTANFLTIDPLLDLTRSPYGYTGGNPLQYTDPLGLDWWEIFIDGQGESLVNNALQSFGAGAVDGISGGINFLLDVVLDPGGTARIPLIGDPNCHDGIYDSSYTVGQITSLVGTVALGARGATGGRTTQAANTVDNVLPTPQVSSTRLQNLVDNLYKGTTNPNRVGTGTTMDAIRSEMATGVPTAGRMHTVKGQETLQGLNNWLRRNPDAPYQDRLVARSLADELARVLGGGS